jgi:hypothetical protein
VTDEPPRSILVLRDMWGPTYRRQCQMPGCNRFLKDRYWSSYCREHYPEYRKDQHTIAQKRRRDRARLARDNWYSSHRNTPTDD